MCTREQPGILSGASAGLRFDLDPAQLVKGSARQKIVQSSDHFST
jgi:hypothetical protein